MSESRTLDETSDNSGSKTDHQTRLLDQIEDQLLDDTHHSAICSAASVGCSDGRTNENSLWRCQNQMNWDNFNGSVDCMDALNGEGPSSVSATKLFQIPLQIHEVSSEDEDYETESSETYNAKSSVKDEEYEELKQFRREDDNTGRETSTLEGINELIRKFSTIELLRRKENLKKAEEAVNNESPSCSSNIRRHASAKRWNPEDFLEDGTFKIPDPRHDWKSTDCDQEESDSDAENEKIRDMEFIKMLVSHALGKDKQQGKKRGDEILTASYIKSKTGNQDNNDLCETEDNMTEVVYGEEDAYSCTVPTLPKSEGESSLDHSEMFDGFEIDCPESFQDWMLDGILSKDLNSSTEIEEKNYFL